MSKRATKVFLWDDEAEASGSPVKRQRRPTERFNPHQADDSAESESLGNESESGAADDDLGPVGNDIFTAIHSCIAANNAMPIVKYFEDAYLVRVRTYGAPKPAWEHVIEMSANKKLWTLTPFREAETKRNCMFCNTFKVCAYSVASDVGDIGHAGILCVKKYKFFEQALWLLRQILKNQAHQPKTMVEIRNSWSDHVSALDLLLADMEKQ